MQQYFAETKLPVSVRSPGERLATVVGIRYSPGFRPVVVGPRTELELLRIEEEHPHRIGVGVAEGIAARISIVN
jgi:hypothetical protein